MGTIYAFQATNSISTCASFGSALTKAGCAIVTLRLHFAVESVDESEGNAGIVVERGADLFVIVGRARLDDVFAERAQH